MNRVAWLIIGTLLALFPIWLVRAAVIDVDVPVKTDVAEEDVRSVLFRASVEKLIKSEMQRMNLDVAAYDTAFNTKFDRFYAEVEKRRRAELEKAGSIAEVISQSVEREKEKERFKFAGWEKLIKRYTIRRFAAHEQNVGVWQMQLDGEVDERLLSIHVQRMLQAEEKAFRRLYLFTQVRPDNFTWEDLKLSKADDFTQPIEAEWLKWFQDNAPVDVEEVVLCEAQCREILEKWRAHDEKAMSSFVAPEFMGSLLLTVNITLSREVLSGSIPETKMSFGGGLILQDLNTKRVLHYADLPTEIQTVRQGDQKQFNSAVASQCYRYPLGKFLEVKNQVGKSVSLTNSMVVRLVNPAHLGQAMRLIEWMRVKGAPMQAQGKLDSFNRKEARVLVFFRGEGNKFKSLVEGVKELESEWGRPLTVDSSGAEIVLTLGEKKP